MWVKANPNPLGKAANDCVVRAIAIATEQSWGRVYEDLCRQGRRMCDMPSSNAVWGMYLQEMGFEPFLPPESCPKCMTVRAFASRMPEGTYIIGTGTHAVAVIAGNYFDNWDSGDETVTYYWRIR